MSTKLNDKTGDQNIFTILHSKLCSCIGHMLPFQRLKDRLDFIHLIQCLRKESTVSKFFKQSGKLFQMTGPEYIKLCLKFSFFRVIGLKSVSDKQNLVFVRVYSEYLACGTS